MHLVCPNCGFDRDIPDEKVPPRAEVATCPKCKEKFRFRSLQEEDPQFTLEEDAANDQQAEALQREEQPAAQEEIWKRLDAMGRPEEEEPGGPSLSPRPYDAEGESTQGPEELSRPQQWEKGHGRQEFLGSSGEAPFERLDKYGFFPGLLLTIKQVLSQPIDFFRRMPTRGGLARPLAFYLLLSLFVAAVQLLSMKYFGLEDQVFHGFEDFMSRSAGQDMSSGLQEQPLTWDRLFISLAMTPVVYLIGFFLTAAITHLFLMIFQAGSRGFEATARVVAYANVPILFSVIPQVGFMIASIWSLVLYVIGLRQAHRTSFARVGLAMLTLALVGMAVVSYALFIFFEGLMTGSI